MYVPAPFVFKNAPPGMDRAKVVAQFFPELESFFAPQQTPFTVSKALASVDTLLIANRVGTASVGRHLRLLQARRCLHVEV